MDAAVELAPALGIVALCAALGLSRATFYRRRQGARPPASLMGLSAPSPEELGGRSPVAVCGHGTEGATAPPPATVSATDADAVRSGADPVASQEAAAGPTKNKPPRALSDPERAQVLATLNQDRFCNLAPAEVYATLLDEGTYLCSQRTMYRILDENSQLRERRNQLRHPAYAAPELMASKPNQLWSWDISVPQISDIGDEDMAPRDRLAGAGRKPPQAAWAKSPGRERCGKGAPEASGENRRRRTTVNCRSSVESAQMTSKPGGDVDPGQVWTRPAHGPRGVRHRGSASSVRAPMLNCGNLRLRCEGKGASRDTRPIVPMRSQGAERLVVAMRSL